MDFIERIFGISPDGGSGTLEWMLFAIPLIVILVVRGVRNHRSRR